MSVEPKTLGLIPARGGSKGIPRKNIKLLAGKPLIAWTIEAALRARSLDCVVVSTDDDEIADVARKYGAMVPFRRPTELAQDNTPGVEPVLHAIDRLPGFNAVLLLQPTSPLRSTEDIDECVALAVRRNAPSVVSLTPSAHHPNWMYRLDADHRLSRLVDEPSVTRRQDLPPVYAVNGALYYARTTWLRQRRRLITEETLGYLMPRERSSDVDSLLDWRFAELLLAELA